MNTNSNILIQGRLTKKQRSAMHFFANYLLSKAMQKHITIKVSFVKNLDGMLGLLTICGYNASNAPREFHIELYRNQSDEEILKTLAHEMVHVNQYAYKELNEEMTMWRGKNVDIRKINYDDQPWEVEAESMCGILVEEYKNQ